MLKVASFPITDAQGVNDLLTKFPLAAGMHILVSEGNIMLPYEDGAPETTAVKIAEQGEKKNKLLLEIGVIDHSQAVLEFLMADAKNRADVAQANFDIADTSKDRKKYNAAVVSDLRGKLHDAQSALNTLAGQHRMNAHEILRLNVNIEKHDEIINKLSA